MKPVTAEERLMEEADALRFEDVLSDLTRAAIRGGKTREMAASTCDYCGKPIGYDEEFVDHEETR